MILRASSARDKGSMPTILSRFRPGRQTESGRFYLATFVLRVQCLFLMVVVRYEAGVVDVRFVWVCVWGRGLSEESLRGSGWRIWSLVGLCKDFNWGVVDEITIFIF